MKVFSRSISVLTKAFIYLWTLFIIFLFLWVILASLNTNQGFLSSFWSFPEHFQWHNYYDAWINANLSRYFLNSVLVVAVSIIGIVILSAPAAYILSRVFFKGRGVITSFFIIGIGIPHQAVVIPLFLMLVKLGLLNSLPGLIIVYIAYSLPFSIFILIGFFSTISSDIEESAAIDGASANRTFWQIVLPIARPGIITVTILNGVGLWNEFLFAYAYLSSGDKYTLPVGLYNFYETMQQNSNWVTLYAGVVIVVIPILVFFLWLSDRIIEGMTAGSGK